MAVASLVLSILALIFAFSLVYGWLGLILGILAIIFAVLGKKSLENQNKSTGVATAGLVMGIIATSICELHGDTVLYAPPFCRALSYSFRQLRTLTGFLFSFSILQKLTVHVTLSFHWRLKHPFLRDVHRFRYHSGVPLGKNRPALEGHRL